ncbi:MAG TPA: hypothetical protein DCY13_16805 [Verrucomicrobiales bacterium]|nr:hypothetical protein [Verrucomicrobiales bacterium]
MKITVELADSLLARIKAQAAKENSTIKNLIEEGLQLVLKTRGGRGSVHIEPVTFAGTGLQPAFQTANCSTLRSAAYVRSESAG